MLSELKMNSRASQWFFSDAMGSLSNTIGLLEVLFCGLGVQGDECDGGWCQLEFHRVGHQLHGIG